VKKEKKIQGMEEGPSKRRYLYQLQQEKLTSTALTEERVLHEAYQFLGTNLRFCQFMSTHSNQVQVKPTHSGGHHKEWINRYLQSYPGGLDGNPGCHRLDNPDFLHLIKLFYPLSIFFRDMGPYPTQPCF